MLFLDKIFPDAYVESVFHLDYQKIVQSGYKAIVFDIDQTLVMHGEPATREIEDLFRHIHALGLKTLLLSNNSAERIEEFITNIDMPYIALADKPKPAAFLKAVEQLGIDKSEVIMIGDQLFTDVLGANRSGIEVILVKFLYDTNETDIGRKRRLEQRLLNLYKRSKKYQRILLKVQ